ncbi:MAG TPA: glycerophosphodiester phosphodiesterase family protein [Kofleriaceae bacterium]|nr:glycerophosphodiester phosphodiesterase family protein [Kofleriaceae bacterium]
MKRFLVLACCLGCGSSNGGGNASADAGGSPGVTPDASAGTSADAAPTPPPVDAPDQSHYRTSLSSCWTDVTCNRALLIAHGGEWVLVDPPYGTTAAYEDAYADAADAIKADVRFSKDGVAVVVHSSPFQAYEIDPIDFSCEGASVEDMNVSDIVACQWINGEHVETLDTLLSWAKGKMIVMLTVKVDATIPQTIAVVIADGATDGAFLEISTNAMTTIVPTAANHDQVYYLVEAASQADVATLLAQADPRAFMYEDANSDNFGGMTASAVTQMIDGQLHPAHVRAFSSIASVTAAASDHEALWDEGFDVVMTNSYATGHQGRIAINTARGISPP